MDRPPRIQRFRRGRDFARRNARRPTGWWRREASSRNDSPTDGRPSRARGATRGRDARGPRRRCEPGNRDEPAGRRDGRDWSSGNSSTPPGHAAPLPARAGEDNPGDLRQRRRRHLDGFRGGSRGTASQGRQSSGRVAFPTRTKNTAPIWRKKGAGTEKRGQAPMNRSFRLRCLSPFSRIGACPRFPNRCLSPISRNGLSLIHI